MTYAQILNGIIVNIIELSDPSLIPLFSIGFDIQCPEVDNITDVNGNPINIGWFYDSASTNFFPPATLALIQNNLVTSVIQNCDAYITNEAANYQYIVDITTMDPQPTIGWSYNGSTFTPSTAYYQELMTEAIAFGNQLIVQYTAENVAAGITQAGQTMAVVSYTSTLITYLQTGSLYAAIAEINTMIADTSTTKTNLAPFVTNDILYTYLNLIQTWLEIPLTQNPGD